MYTHGGDIREMSERYALPEKDVVDFSANINPYGPPDWFRSLISAEVSSLVNYPDPACRDFVNAVSKRYQVKKDEVIVGNGSTEILYAIPRALDLKKTLIVVPAYGDYAEASKLAGFEVDYLLLKEKDMFRVNFSDLEAKIDGNELVFLGQPNNPTGLLFDTVTFRSFAIDHPSTVFVVDEAFFDFVEGGDSLTINRPSNVIVLCSLTKFYSLPGLRLGCAVANKESAEKIKQYILPWSVNSLAQTVAVEALKDSIYADESRKFVKKQRKLLLERFQSISDITVYPGVANFLFIRINNDRITAPLLAEKMFASGFAIRVCDNFEGLDERFFRIAVKNEKENLMFCSALEKVFGVTKKRSPKKRKAVTLQIQGTSSNAGKSLLSAAFCRILLEDGFRVAPFKSQNMSLNSFVTDDGGEMGRAQVMQAQACKIKPDVRMNPILLKPTTDVGSQVIINGKSVGNKSVNEYIQYKPQAFQSAKDSFDSLSEYYDAVVLEGAGSPAEVNLKHHDIVNFKMAEYAKAPVLIVGDIDRGGIFASFVGTMEVLSEEERAMVSGFIINKFRGNAALLDDAISFTERHTGRPILGTVPYIKDYIFPEEDSVSFKDNTIVDVKKDDAVIEIAIIDLPHISNFTDFDALKIEPDVQVRIVKKADKLGTPDCVVIPGSRNVISDLKYLFNSGMAEKIITLAKKDKTEIVGICGGYQMLGMEISDPYGIESLNSTIAGLKLLSGSTKLKKEKYLKAVTATHEESGLILKGYEIHHGETDIDGLKPIIRRANGDVIGVGLTDGNVWGTYLHGVFDADKFRRFFIDRLRKRRGVSTLNSVQVSYDLEPAFTHLAKVVRESVQMKEIYRMMGL